jgi:hypothetical protein
MAQPESSILSGIARRIQRGVIRSLLRSATHRLVHGLTVGVALDSCDRRRHSTRSPSGSTCCPITNHRQSPGCARMPKASSFGIDWGGLFRRSRAAPRSWFIVEFLGGCIKPCRRAVALSSSKRIRSRSGVIRYRRPALEDIRADAVTPAGALPEVARRSHSSARRPHDHYCRPDSRIRSRCTACGSSVTFSSCVTRRLSGCFAAS